MTNLKVLTNELEGAFEELTTQARQLQIEMEIAQDRLDSIFRMIAEASELAMEAIEQVKTKAAAQIVEEPEGRN